MIGRQPNAKIDHIVAVSGAHDVIAIAGTNIVVAIPAIDAVFSGPEDAVSAFFLEGACLEDARADTCLKACSELSADDDLEDLTFDDLIGLAEAAAFLTSLETALLAPSINIRFAPRAWPS